jgi:hypothetical protein
MAARYRGLEKHSMLDMCALSLLLWTALLFIAACGGNKEVRKESRDYRISQEAFSVAEALRTAYAKKDLLGIQGISTREGNKEIVDSIRYFDSVDLTFTPRWVEIEKSKVYLNVAWKGIWTVGGEITRERGSAVFLLEGSPLKISKVLRGSPFKYPER